MVGPSALAEVVRRAPLQRADLWVEGPGRAWQAVDLGDPRDAYYAWLHNYWRFSVTKPQGLAALPFGELEATW